MELFLLCVAISRKNGRISTAIRAKKNPFQDSETDFKFISRNDYNSNANVNEILLLIASILAPSVNPLLKNPCCEFLLA